MMSDRRHGSEGPSTQLELRHASTDHAVTVVVPERTLLVIEGVGQTHAADFLMATAVLRRVEEILRSRSKPQHFVDSHRPVLELVWLIPPDWLVDEILAAFAEGAPWHWRQMIELLPGATTRSASEAIEEARRQAERDVPLVRLIRLSEGRVAQLLHVGPTDLSRSVGMLYRFVSDLGLQPRGDLHQLLLADPTVVPPDRARSIYRVPVASE